MNRVMQDMKDKKKQTYTAYGKLQNDESHSLSVIILNVK